MELIGMEERKENTNKGGTIDVRERERGGGLAREEKGSGEREERK